MSALERPPNFTYVRSADGTSIAYMRLGAGPKLVVVSPVSLSNISGDWAIPLMRDVFERLALGLELILCDGRGTGASQHSVKNLSNDALTADVEAVIGDMGTDPVALLAMYASDSEGGPR